MIAKRQEHYLITESLNDINNYFVTPISFQDIENMKYRSKKYKTIFPEMHHMLCSTINVTVGQYVPDNVINFGPHHTQRFFAIDSFDDENAKAL